jgi:ketosteroid isomerase-like protein
MSQENVELAHRTYDAFNRRDLPAFLGFVDPGVEFVSGSGLIEGGSRHGHDGIRVWWDELFSVYPDWMVEVLEVRETADDGLVVSVQGHGHGAASGAPVDTVMWQVVKLRNRKIVWWSTHTVEAEALEAAGLSE